MPQPRRPKSPDASTTGRAPARKSPIKRAARAAKAAAEPPARPVRRTQESRSSETQRRLCQAAVELLSEVGYERLTTAQIAQRAGVSKGAQAHHYPTKDDMLVAAFAHQLNQWESQREHYADRLGPKARMEDILQSMWQLAFGRPDFLALIELMLAARHHPSLGERLRERLAGWTVLRDETFRRLIPIEDPEELALFLQVTFCVLRGLAVYEGLSSNASLPQKVLAQWTVMADAYLAARTQARPTAAKRPSSQRSSPSRRLKS